MLIQVATDSDFGGEPKKTYTNCFWQISLYANGSSAFCSLIIMIGQYMNIFMADEHSASNIGD